MTKIFKVPFADTGDKISPPDAIQPDGSVSYGLGYGFDYQRDTSLDSGGAPVDPLAKVFPREQHNGILNDITTAIGEVQKNGFAIWQASAAPYPINAVVRYGDKTWRSLVASNTVTPAENESWTETSGKFVGLGGTSPIQLNAGSGSTAGNVYARLGSSDLGYLWHSGNFDPAQKITGENCPQAGFTAGGTLPYMKKTDGTVVALAVRANTVLEGNTNVPNVVAGASDERIANTRFVTTAIAANPAIGVSQTWQDVTGSRSKNVNYTNNTSRPIQILIKFDPDGDNSVLTISGHPFNVTDNQSEFVSAIIPIGGTYKLSAWGVASEIKWLELR